MLPGMIRFIGGDVSFSIDFIASAFSTTNGTSHSYSVAIPNYGQDVLMIVGIGSRSTSLSHAFSSVTWNSISGSSLVNASVGILNNFLIGAMYSLAIPASSQGTTQNLTIVTNAAAADQTGGIWVVRNYLSATPQSTPSTTDSSNTTLALNYGTRNVSDGILSFVTSYKASDISWTGFGTEDFDDDTAANGQHFAGYRDLVTSAGSYSKTLTASSSYTYGIALGASFR